MDFINNNKCQINFGGNVMKKLLFPILVSIMMLMLFGCKSDTPVQANEDTGSVTSLQRPSINFSINYSAPNLICTWSQYKGAKSYEIWRFWDINLNLVDTVPAAKRQTNYADTINVSTWASGTYYIRINAVGSNGNYVGSQQAAGYVVIP